MHPVDLREIRVHLLPNFPYRDFLILQEELTENVRKAPSSKHLILCNHPCILTQGRGDRQNCGTTIVHPPAGWEMISVNRGGGVTFHGPNQLVIYLIAKLTKTFGFKSYLQWLQNFTITLILEHLHLELEAKRNPLGLWKEGKKYASIGIGINRFITNHGLALNIGPLPLDSKTIESISPCGLSAESYSYLAHLNPQANVESFFRFVGERI